MTYPNLTTQHIFTIDKKAAHQKRPTGYADLITGDGAGLLKYGLVAEVEGQVRRFTLGRLAHIGEKNKEVGMILILSVHPDHWGKVMGRELINALCEKYRSQGIKTVNIGLDTRDKDLLAFFKRLGFSGE